MAEEMENAIKGLFNDHLVKVEKYRALVGTGLSQEAFDEFEKTSLAACQEAARTLVNKDLYETFAPFGIDLSNLVGADDVNTSASRQYTNRKRRVSVNPLNATGAYVCDREGCGKAFVNAGNLKNHSFVHEREDRMRAAMGDDAVEGMVGNKRKSRKSKSADGEQDEEADASSSTEPRVKRPVGGALHRKNYSLEEKLQVLEKYDEMHLSNDTKDTQHKVAAVFNISQSLVSKWLKQRPDIEETYREINNPTSAAATAASATSSGDSRPRVKGGGVLRNSKGGGLALAAARVAAAAAAAAAQEQHMASEGQSSSSSGSGSGSSSVEANDNTAPAPSETTFDGAVHNVTFPKKKGKSRIGEPASVPSMLAGDILILGDDSNSDDDDDEDDPLKL